MMSQMERDRVELPGFRVEAASRGHKLALYKMPNAKWWGVKIYGPRGEKVRSGCALVAHHATALKSAMNVFWKTVKDR